MGRVGEIGVLTMLLCLLRAVVRAQFSGLILWKSQIAAGRAYGGRPLLGPKCAYIFASLDGALILHLELDV